MEIKLLKRAEVARILGISLRTLDLYRSKGAIPKPDTTIGRMPRWNEQTILRWLKQGGN
jgi:predicted DNA-binding transcriptional regulator AlpA